MSVTVPGYFTDEQLETLERNPEFRERGRACPVCDGTNRYWYQEIAYECPDDDYGHPMLRLAKLYWLHNIPLQYQKLIWDEFPHADDKREIEQYLNHFRLLRMSGSGISVFGTQLGVGKTWAATHVLKECVKQSYSGWFVTFFDLKNNFEVEDRKQRDWNLQQMINSEILVIDDVVAPWSSQAQRHLFEEQLERIVRPRTNMNFPTLITTNMTEQDFAVEYPRVDSLLSAKNFKYVFQGKDARINGIVWENNQMLALKGETRPIT